MIRVSQFDLYDGFSISRTSQRNEKWFEIYRNEGKFLLTCFGSLLLMGPKDRFKEIGSYQKIGILLKFLKLLGNGEQAVSSSNNNKNTKNKKRTSLSPPRSNDYRECVTLMVL